MIKRLKKLLQKKKNSPDRSSSPDHTETTDNLRARHEIEYDKIHNQPPYKLGQIIDNQHMEYQYENMFYREEYPEWSRVTISSNSGYIELIKEIVGKWDGPLGVLYVLSVPRTGRTPARYQSPSPCSFSELCQFCDMFSEYFEKDGRHHIWFIDVTNDRKVVYDNHNLLYVYGDDTNVINLLKEKDFVQYPISIPAPHVHRYNPELDHYEDRIMTDFNWIEFPIVEEHDD